MIQKWNCICLLKHIVSNTVDYSKHARVYDQSMKYIWSFLYFKLKLEYQVEENLPFLQALEVIRKFNFFTSGRATSYQTV